MTLSALRDDALVSTPDGFTLRLGLPWIRSLPVASLLDLSVAVDGEHVPTTAPEGDWWFIQDRLNIQGAKVLSPGAHQVAVSFRLAIPYLQISADGPLILPFTIERTLTVDAADPTPIALAERSAAKAPTDDLPAGWTLAASAFNWTPEVVAADRDALDIAVGIVADGVASVIEVEPGQLWRSYPTPTEAEADQLRSDLDAAGGSISIVGGSLDDWASTTRRRSEAERLAFLLPQLQTAARLGATGIRLPIGQAGEPLLRELLPTLHELNLVLFEEAQGHQTPTASAAAYDAIAQLNDPHVRLLIDISMLMPALPQSYIEQLRAASVPGPLLARLENEWSDPATHGAVIDVLRSGQVPPQIHTLFMNLLVRFGRSDAGDLRSILPLVGGFHLKFWDLDDADGRVSAPIRDLGALLAMSNFAGPLCSEWGGHEWLNDDPTTMTRRHLELARTALQAGAGLSAGASR